LCSWNNGLVDWEFTIKMFYWRARVWWSDMLECETEVIVKLLHSQVEEWVLVRILRISWIYSPVWKRRVGIGVQLSLACAHDSAPATCLYKLQHQLGSWPWVCLSHYKLVMKKSWTFQLHV
jgi:hypothetical protein